MMNDSRPAPPIDDKQARTGLVFGLLAYGLWGVLPIYFKQLAGVSPIDIVAHRIIWSLAFLGVLVAVTRGWGQVRAGLKDRRTLRLLVTTSVLIAVNWLLYVYAVTSGHILAGSLGYYLNPLMNIVLGRFILKERLTKLQWTAVAIAGAGVAVLAAGAGTTLWISLALCVTFATYGLLRKVAAIDAVAGLSIETALLFPVALIWLAAAALDGGAVMGSTRAETWLLILSGIASTTPLLLFTSAARRLRYSTLGMLQFAAPTLQFILAVAIYGEEFTRAHGIAFASIWLALVLYVLSMVRDLRAQRSAAMATDLCEG
jgi:chloramphenicol-sensitive protein RarD